jgi:cell filamentation protein
VANYTYPDTDTVKNKFGEIDFEKLEHREGRLIAARLLEIEAGNSPEGQFDGDHLKAIHRHLFQDVYEWAGHTRDELVKLSDGTEATEPIMHRQGGLDFLAGHLIPHTLDDLAKRVREADYLRGLSREEFATRAADIMAVLNDVHPFRDGNGHTQRAFVRALADQAGHSPDFTVVSRERMIQASTHDDPTMMHCLFNEISDPSRVAALRQAIELLERRRFPWNDRYLATTEPGQPVELAMVGTIGYHFIGRSGARILIGNTSDLPWPHPRSHETFRIVQVGAGEKAGNSFLSDLTQLAPAYDPPKDHSDDPAKPGGHGGR